MSITINGNGTITGISVGGLPDGIVDTDMIANSVNTGKILQVINMEQTSSPSTSSNTYSDTGLTANITPSATTSKILIQANVLIGQNAGNYGEETGIKILRDSTDIFTRGDFFRIFESGQQVTRNYAGQLAQHLDTPNTTSQITYKVQWKTQDGGTVYMLGGSNITLMEIAA